MSASRKLIEPLEQALQKDGVLHPLVERVLRDHTLDLQFRGHELHVYYRGGRILALKHSKRGGFASSFDEKYYSKDLAREDRKTFPRTVREESDILEWTTGFSELKEQMDRSFAKDAEKNEREFQQLLVRDNNYTSVANETDYFILDTEYENRDIGEGRADMIAIKWNKNDRKRGAKAKLVLIEVKYGDKALENKSGIVIHTRRMLQLANDKSAMAKLQREMLAVFDQKRKLGLVRFGKKGNTNPIEEITDPVPEVMLVLINHNPSATKLASELKKLSESELSQVSFAASSFLGYGLYERSIYSYEDFASRFSHLLNKK